MGQKVNPHGLRVGVIKNWDTSWFASKKDFSKYLAEDYKLREYVKRKCYQYGVSKIEIERAQGKVIVNIFTSKPGMIIGQKGAGVETLKKELSKIAVGKSLHLNILEVKRPDLDSVLVAESIAAQIEKRASFKRTMKQAMQRVMRAGAKGVKVMLAGRLDGAEIARTVHYHEGSIPLQTLRADIDYGTAEAHTTFGIIGIKVWIYKGEVLGKPSITAARDRDTGNEGQKDFGARGGHTGSKDHATAGGARDSKPVVGKVEPKAVAKPPVQKIEKLAEPKAEVKKPVVVAAPVAQAPVVEAVKEVKPVAKQPETPKVATIATKEDKKPLAKVETKEVVKAETKKPVAKEDTKVAKAIKTPAKEGVSASKAAEPKAVKVATKSEKTVEKTEKVAKVAKATETKVTKTDSKVEKPKAAPKAPAKVAAPKVAKEAKTEKVAAPKAEKKVADKATKPAEKTEKVAKPVATKPATKATAEKKPAVKVEKEKATKEPAKKAAPKEAKPKEAKEPKTKK